VMYFTQELWIALPILVTAVWYRMHEEAYNHYKSIKKGMNYDTDKAKEVEQS
jgi:1,4-dihydroxy-2-naphthoate octaprenyltransferase